MGDGVDRGPQYEMNQQVKKGISYENAFNIALKGFAHRPKRIMLVCVDKGFVESNDVTETSLNDIANLIGRYKYGQPARR